MFPGKIAVFLGGGGGEVIIPIPTDIIIVDCVGQSVGHMLVAYVGGTRWPVF